MHNQNANQNPAFALMFTGETVTIMSIVLFPIVIR